MNTETPSNDTRWSEENSELNLWDLLQVLKANWYWFLLSVIVCLGAAYVYLLQAPRVYTRAASVLIKDERRSSRTISTYGFSDLNNMLGIPRNVDNEVIVFKSYRLMEKVARRLRLDISYTEKRGLRTVELYRQSPVTLSFPDAEEAQSFSLTVMPLSKDKVRLFNFVTTNSVGEVVEVEKPQDVALNDTVNTPVGRVVVQPSLYYADTYYNREIRVRKSNLQGVATGYQRALVSDLAAEYATIVNLSLSDVSISRAEDVLNTLIAVYNEDAIEDKNRITVNTSEFIAERLVIIEQELGSVDADIETFIAKCAERGVSVKWFGNKEPNGFTSAYDSWQYFPYLATLDLPTTRRVLATMCDMRLPLTFTVEDCDVIADIIAEVVTEMGLR